MIPKKNDLDNIHYSNNYLSKVIIRIDFESPIDKLKSQVDKSLSNIITKSYPAIELNEKREVFVKDLHEEEKQIIIDAWKEWKYINYNKNKTLILTHKALLIEYRQYDNFESFRDEFIEIIGILYATYNDIRCRRLGLRYINSIDIKNENNALQWKDYIQPQLLGAFNIEIDAGKLLRILNFIDINFGQFQIRMQYGMQNPDYPAPIKIKQFVIDIDAYSDYFHDFDAIKKNTANYHDKIQVIFENSITEKLRKRMK